MTIGAPPDVIDGIPYTQIEEITGINDRPKILKTWTNCSMSIQDREELTHAVITNLLEATVPSPDVKPVTTVCRSQSMETLTGKPSSSDAKPIENENNDVQKAIAASLQDMSGSRTMLGGQLSQEDREISRAVEDSINQNKNLSGQTRYWSSNPCDQLRTDSWPVGLENVGNTCWFNAVIQSLFHITEFRDLIINYEPSDSVSKENPTSTFMMEMKRLFALMMASDRRYLNPSGTVDILRNLFEAGPSGGSEQQDVSEFQHKLLDWLEEAFQHKKESVTRSSGDTETSSSIEPMEVDDAHPKDKDDHNEMVKLFYGRVKTYGHNEGSPVTTDFGQWLLHVDGFSDIHESLEDSLVQTINAESTSNLEQWFTRLPPVLTFELSRFRFDQKLTKTEKLHNKLSFPQFIFMDRYLDENKEDVRRRREKVRELRNELASLERKLGQLTQYGSGKQKYPLLDVLDYTLEYAKSSCERHREQNISADLRDKLECTCSRDCHTQPRVHTVSQEELMVLSSCITRWRTNVREDMHRYEKSASSFRADIQQAYDQRHLQQCKYCLHAVMVHEGEAISGHYWAYIHSQDTDTWLKYNDVSVTRTTWEELVRDSEGGLGTASAYCLIYVQCSNESCSSPSTAATASTAVTAKPGGFVSKQDSLASLPADVRDYVTLDNQQLAAEITKWHQRQQAVVVSQSRDRADITSTPSQSSLMAKYHSGIKSEVSRLATDHAQSLLMLATKCYTELKPTSSQSLSPDATLDKLLDMCYHKYHEAADQVMSRSSRVDHRVHVTAYIIAVYGQYASQEEVKMVIADQLAKLDGTTATFEEGWPAVHNEASMSVNEYWSKNPGFQSRYINWHRDCHQFRHCLTVFSIAVLAFNQSQYERALVYLQESYHLSKKVSATRRQCENPRLKSLNMSLLKSVRRNCLLKFNETALNQFETEEDFQTPLRVMEELVLPILDEMQADESSDESELVSCIKDQWVRLLDEQFSEEKMEAVNNFITKLFEPATRAVQQLPDKIEVPMDIGNRYKQVMAGYWAAVSETNMSD